VHTGDFILELFKQFGDWALVVLGGIAGGIIGARLHPEATKGTWNFVVYVVIGFFFAVFGAPWAAEMWGITSPRGIAGLGFFSAILWMPITERAKMAISEIRFPFQRGDKP
jgi:hypothetical protein